MASRLRVLQAHLTGSPSKFDFPTVPEGLALYRAKGLPFDSRLLRLGFDGLISDYFAECMRRSAQVPICSNRLYHDKSRKELRELYVRQILEYYKTGAITLEEDEGDSRKLAPFIGGLWAMNQGLAIRLSVHILLYADTIRGLGSEKHRKYLERAYKLKDYGSLSLTEFGHGSNASGVETTATYDHAKREFVFNSPTAMAAKWWIGAVGKTANMTVAFAKLMMNGVNQGVHVFLIPIRDYETHKPLPGLTLGDCGPKEGCEGIDNGFIIFTNYRAPYDCLLDRFSHISDDGKFKTSIKNKDKRFAAMMAGMIRGRYGIIAGTILNLRNALTIAIRYSAGRVQFGPKNGPEVPILDYQITRYRIMPHLAKLFAAYAGCELVRNMIEQHRAAVRASPEGRESGELHSLLSVVKPLCSWYSQRGIQECRELLAGHGYSSFSGLGMLLTDNDVNSTWEGENNILMQQTSRYIFKNVQRIIKGMKVESEYLTSISIDPSQMDERPNITSKSSLRDNLPLLKKMLEHRMNLLVHKSMLRMQENVTKFGDVLDIWNNSQVYFLQPLAIAFGELVFANELMKISEVTRSKHVPTGELYTRITELYVLTTIARDLGTFREKDYLSSDQGNIVKDYELDLCSEVADNSVKIIDSIALPEKLIGSPFAARDGNMYREYVDLVEQAEGCYDPPSWLELIKEVRKAL